MSDIMLDDLELREYVGGDEAAEYDFGAEDDDSYLGEAESRRARLRKEEAARARRRRAALDQRKQGRRPAPPARTAKAAIQRTRDDVQNLELASMVRDDAIGTKVRTLSNRTAGVERAAIFQPVAAQLQSQLGDFIPGLSNDTSNLLRGVIGYLPVAFARPTSKGIRNPQIQAVVASLGIVGLGALFRRLNTKEGDGTTGARHDGSTQSVGGAHHPDDEQMQPTASPVGGNPRTSDKTPGG